MRSTSAPEERTATNPEQLIDATIQMRSTAASRASTLPAGQ